MKVNIGRYKANRKIKVWIDSYDVWNADETLAHIILPVLKRLKKDKHGSPEVSDEDVPDELKIGDVHTKWNWVLDEIIWTFENHIPENDSESQFWVHAPKDCKTLREKMQSMQYDIEGHTAWMNRKQNGFRLFGVYYQALWT